MTITVEQLQQGGYTAQNDRNVDMAMMVKSAAVTALAGIIPSDGTDFTVAAQGSPNMTVNVTKGDLVIPDAAGGAYLFHNSASDQNPTITTAPGSGTRYDLIIARVYDNAAGDVAATGSLTLPGSAGSINVQTVTGTIEVVTGSPGGSPSPPSLPNARCVVLAIVHVGTNVTSITSGAIQTSQSTTSRVGYTVAAGGILPVSSSAAYPATPYVGMRLYDLALGYDVEWNGTYWRARAGLAMDIPRVSANASDTYASGSFQTMASGTWNNAPQGDYLISADLVFFATGAIAGSLKLVANGVDLTVDSIGTEMRADGATSLQNAHVRGRKITYAGGNLALSLQHELVSGTGTVMQAGTGLTAQYLG